MYVTADGGASWKQLALPYMPGKGELRAAHFLSDEKTGWIVGGKYRPASRSEILTKGWPNNTISANSDAILHAYVFRTDDGGATWHEQFSSSQAGRFLSLMFFDADHGVALGDVGIYYSENGGKEWKSASLTAECADKDHSNSYEYHPAAAFTLNSSTAWLIYDDGYLVKTEDGGRTWCEVTRLRSILTDEAVNLFFREIYFSDLTRGWALNESGVLYEIEDAGKTWKKGPTDLRFEDMYFLDPYHGWLVSKDGLFSISS
jgi:photosystem II stability/assembly factor-like uncharacterized protein